MSPETAYKPLILASGSPHRASLLQRLRIPFEVLAPDIDERPRDNEAPHDLATRLAVEKALRISTDRTAAIVIGSDQVVVHGGQLSGKPGNAEIARRQLSAFSGNIVQFLTSVALIAEGDTVLGQSVVETRVEFRHLSAEEIDRYLDVDAPWECAGGFRAESLGPALFESVFSQDPTAIIGLPLIETARLLRVAGFKVP